MPSKNALPTVIQPARHEARPLLFKSFSITLRIKQRHLSQETMKGELDLAVGVVRGEVIPVGSGEIYIPLPRALGPVSLQEFTTTILI